jgi:uncharacterized 2Fe-2S/4Fe-4S cluster protein (DUF4445 family)
VEVCDVGRVLACRYAVADDLEVVLPAVSEAVPRLRPVEGNPGLSVSGTETGAMASCPGRELSASARGAEDLRQYFHGLAIDIGTTTVEVCLERLGSPALLGRAGLINPQVRYGHDVISRIHYAMENPEGLEVLRRELVSRLNETIRELCGRETVDTADVCRVTVVGNTTMLHVLLGVDPAPIARAPHAPVFVETRTIPAADIGFEVGANASVCVLPSVSGFVGADVTAGVASTNLAEREELSLYVDLGTNGEVVLGNRDALLCCATAAGPAFEGGRIRCGMGGEEGAACSYRDGEYATIGGCPPRGICGAGLVDIAADLLRRGVLDGSGFMVEPFTVVAEEKSGTREAISVTPADIRELQAAIAAVYAGIRTLMDEAAAEWSEVARVYLAGGLGSSVNVDSAVAVGLLPAALRGRTVTVGNSAVSGARLALRSTRFAEEVERIARRMRYVELSMRREFNECYVNSMAFGRR